MRKSLSPLQAAHVRQQGDLIEVSQFTREARRKVNSNAARNTYLSLNQAQVESAIAAIGCGETQDAPLLGVPISIKDCFDLEGFRTTCGSKFYANNSGPAVRDSWIATQIRRSGGSIMGKTHMQQLAYGITGENADFGDCVQPDDASLLTGGSSSGAAASIQEGSALAAIGTDTGGSIRVPAALCGIAGYRSSLGIGSWQGGVHLAPSFDTLGVLFRDVRDGPELAEALFGVRVISSRPLRTQPHIAVVREDFLHDSDPLVRSAFFHQQEQLRQAGAVLDTVTPGFWSGSIEIFAAIQAHEAAAIQREKLALRADFTVFEPQIAERLAWGESLAPRHLQQMRTRHLAFVAAMDAMLAEYDFLMLPCAPMYRLQAGADHSGTRQQILRYTTPISLAGMPVVTLPHPGGAGMQLVAARGRDAELLAYAATLETNISD